MENLIQRQVRPWLFVSIAPFSSTTFDGRSIGYGLIAFEGSPSDVFWQGYIEPFLEDLVVREVGAAATLAGEKAADLRALLPDVQLLLTDGITRVYEEMERVHARHLTMDPRSTKKAPRIEPKIARMSSFAEERIAAELKVYRHVNSVERWHRQNQLVAWLVGVLIALLAIAVSIYGLRAETQSPTPIHPVPSIGPAAKQDSAPGA